MEHQPEWLDAARAVLALLFVVGLIFLLKTLLARTGLVQKLAGAKSESGLALTDTLYLDPKRRLVVVRYRGGEHLLLLGPSGDKVVESRREGQADA